MYFVNVNIRKKTENIKIRSEYNGLRGPYENREDAIAHLERLGWVRVGCDSPNPHPNRWVAYIKSFQLSIGVIAHANIVIKKNLPKVIKGKSLPKATM